MGLCKRKKKNRKKYERVKRKWATLFIPKNTPYCHHSFKYNKKLMRYYAKPCKYWCYKYDNVYGYKREYCKYLKVFLDIKDQVKDCRINEDFKEE